MFDQFYVQAEVDYRRERLSRSKPVKRRRPEDRVRIPFVGEHTTLSKRAR